MKKYGHIIKFERIRQNLKQVQLSEGICTPSYLSRIENNSIVPTDEVLLELFNRLNITYSNSSLTDEEFMEKMRTIYSKALKYRDSNWVSISLKEILETKYLFSNPMQFHTFILMLVRLKIISNQGISDDIQSFMLSISKFIDDFNPYQSFLYYSCLGYFNYFKNDLTKSLKCLEKAAFLIPECKFKEFESADFYNVFGILNLYHNNLILSLESFSKAQDFFNKELLLSRAVETYISSAIAYKRASNLEKHFEYLSLAEKLAKDAIMTENLALIYSNLANYYSINNNIDLALINYHKSLDFSTDPFVKLRIIYSIVLQYSITYNFKKVVEWCEKGLMEYNTNQSHLTKNLYHHFQIHLSIHNDYEDFETKVKDAVQYFKEINDYRNAHKYAILIANFFKNAGKYKKATNFFVLANEYLAKKEKRLFKEEI